MKALRKCACVAVQLVVTTALLFQQCPVQAIALGVERGSDYVEITASGEDADSASAAAADESARSEGAETSHNPNDEGRGIEQSSSQDGLCASVPSDYQNATASEDTLYWQRIGDLEISKDSNKRVVLRPADGA